MVLVGGASGTLRAGPSFTPGGEADGPSVEAAISADGRYVAFASEAANLVPGDGNEVQDIFVRDRQTNETLRISIGDEGQEADNYSESPAISSDGRTIAFHSLATNLVPSDTNLEADVFVYDRQAGVTERVSVTSEGAQAAGASFYPALSADGRFVAFVSSATNLDPLDTDPANDVYVHDRQTGTTELVSVNRSGKQGAGYAERPSISADGNIVAFSSIADTLVADDTNEYEDIFARDRSAGKTRRISVRTDGGEVFADSYDPAVSADGRFVAFWSYAIDLTDDELDGYWNVFIHDRDTGTTDLISRGAEGGAADHGSNNPALSGDGRLVAYESEATNLTSGADGNNAADVFLRDRQEEETELLSRSASGPGDAASTGVAITPDGRYVVFQSLAGTLIPGDENGASDIFLVDRTTGESERISLASETAEVPEYRVYLPFVKR